MLVWCFFVVLVYFVCLLYWFDCLCGLMLFGILDFEFVGLDCCLVLGLVFCRLGFGGGFAMLLTCGFDCCEFDVGAGFG